MKASWQISVGVVLLIVAGVLWLRWKEGEPRRLSFQTLAQFDAALRADKSADVLSTVCLPAAIQGRTAPEQGEFLSKALAAEISADGRAVLQKEGTFGPLINLLPAEAEAWTKQAGVKAEDCLAFKLDRKGLHAVVALARLSTLNSKPSTTFRPVSGNNVKELASATQL